jgi:hypothetical protein
VVTAIGLAYNHNVESLPLLKTHRLAQGSIHKSLLLFCGTAAETISAAANRTQERRPTPLNHQVLS